MSNGKKIKYSPAQIAEAIGQYRPNEDQEKVITAPIDQPMLAIAGAGAGKTATMAFRVVYLVANGLVAPDRVLGLTFSVKADRELANRLSNYLQALADNPDFPEVAEYLTDSETGGVILPETATYNAFANQIVHQYGARLGVSPNCVLLDEARRWQIMYEIVSNWPGDLSTNNALSTVVERALGIGSQLRDQLVDVEWLRAQLSRMRELYGRDLTGGNVNSDEDGNDNSNATIRDFVKSMKLRGELLNICAEYEKYKHQNGYLEYADQIYYAAELVEKFSDIRTQLSERYDVILLDEFQDTSVAQLKLFSRIFTGKGAMAVGDPNQAIYGWRGASELSMRDFLTEFGVSPENTEGHVQDMPVTYRNRENILKVANQIVQPIRNLAEGCSAAEVEARVRQQLESPEIDYGSGPAPSPSAFAAPAASVKAKELVTCDQKLNDPGKVHFYFVEDSEEEAKRIADFFAEKWEQREQIVARNEQLAPEDQEKLPTGAILVRRHSQKPLIIQELHKRGLPVEITGVAGLIYDPAVADVIAALQVSADAGRGDSLMRLITGCGISPADIDLLWRHARHLANPEDNPDINPQAYLMDALDNLPEPGWKPQGTASAFSTEAYRRLNILRSQLAEVRRHIHDPLGSLVQRTIFALRVDLDVKARPEGELSARCLETFVRVAREYQSTGVSENLISFLDWLKLADKEGGGLDKPLEEPNPDAIQLMTIHAAKGLEWTWVAVPGLDELRSGGGTLPDHAISASKGACSDSAWISDTGMLPYDLRSDREVLPTIERALEATGYDFDANTFADNAKVIENYKAALGFHSQLADRRLAYVAFTRAESELLIGGCEHSGTGKTKRVPSQFLAEIDSSGEMRELRNQDTVKGAWEATPRQICWPPDPSAELSRLSDAAAQLSALIEEVPADSFLSRLVHTADAEEALALAGSHSPWMQQAVQLVRDEQAETEIRGQVELPISSGVTRAHRIQEDPEGFALSQRRPLPEFPTGGATVGTLFHEWVDQELRGSVYSLPQDIDEELRISLQRLQRKWKSGTVHPDRGWEYLDSEIEFAAPLATKLVARIDAIMRNPATGKPAIIDWKTDSLIFDSSGEIASESEDKVANYMRQINTYRLVYADSLGLRLEDVEAALYFVRHDLLCNLNEWTERLNLPQKLEELLPDLR
ncbi:ATP-dependent DNA helicase [uncultured Varibaculum sp.]|uniref:ATP-dependent DNA helicase n=1 Tax=uncultured Varibaculum sp. TaxID=413896 RepID=UPI00288AA1FC|nr:ATP-dependent DNA helicase [uncultured Varibaculum sp.]